LVLGLFHFSISSFVSLYLFLDNRYLQSGFYAGGLLTKDPLVAFLEGPGGRTKQVLQNVMVIVGWADVSEGYDKERFKLAFVEEVSFCNFFLGGREGGGECECKYQSLNNLEVWRRNFSNFYKAQPREIVLSTIEKLIYGPPLDAANTVIILPQICYWCLCISNIIVITILFSGS
jgi:hypothetical protein